PRVILEFHRVEWEVFQHRPRSSGDRALASGARCAGSNPAGGTIPSPLDVRAVALTRTEAGDGAAHVLELRATLRVPRRRPRIALVHSARRLAGRGCHRRRALTPTERRRGRLAG